MTSTTAPTIRIFISSPADVRAERAIAERVIRKLDREFSYHFRVEAVLWEREPLTADAHFQDATNIPPPRTCDIVVVILWSRLGVVLPPEQFRGALSGGPVTGTEWEFEDALASHRERQLPDLLVYRKRAPLSASLEDEKELEQRVAQKRLVEEFFRRWFRGADGGFTAASWEFATTLEFEEQVETHLRRLLAMRAGEGAGGAELRRWFEAPFRGLASFEVEHAPVFFGRKRAQHELREALGRQTDRGVSFVCVVGASGSGKSSLVKAGLLADLRDAGMVGRLGLCRYAILRPGDARDGNVVAVLAAALMAATALPELAQPPIEETAESLAKLLADAPEHAGRLIRQALGRAAAAAKLTEHAEARAAIVVDQLEELFTSEAIGAAQRQRFAGALAALARSGQAFVIATLRSDFQDRVESVPVLAGLMAGEGRYVLLPPGEAEIAQMIRQPAREAGVRFEADAVSGTALDDEILAAASASPASLPLLSFVLDQLWQRRTEAGMLTRAAYHALGGFAGALGQRAEEVFRDLPPETQAALPQVLWALTTSEDGAQSATARPARLDQFAAGTPARRLVEAFAAPQARLLVLDGAVADAQARVAHEALLTHWERARAQLETDRADRALRSRLEQAEALWRATAEGERASRLLQPGRPLVEAEDLRTRRGGELDPRVVAFVEASAAAARAAAAAEQARQQREIRRTRIAAAVLALLLVAAAGAGLVAWQQRQEAVAQQARALEQEAEARTQRDLAQQRAGEAERARTAEAEQRRTAEQRAAEALRSRALAVGAANTLVIETTDRLRPLAGVSTETVQQVLRTAEGVFDRIAAESGDTPALRLSRASALIAVGDTHAAVGESAAALDRLREAFATLASLAEQDPANAGLQRELARSREHIGLVLMAQGDLAGALDAFRAGHAIIERLAAQDPTNALWQRDLAAGQVRIGDVLMAQGDLAGALGSFQASRAVAERVASQDPGNLALQAVSLSVVRVGNVLQLQGELPGALSAYRSGLEIAQRLIARDPRNTDWQHDAVVTQSSVGDVLRAQGDLAGALGAYRAGNAIAERLAAQDPHNANWQRELAVSDDHIGDALRARGDLAGSLGAYQRGHAILEQLVAQDPGNSSWQRELAISHEKMGDVLQDQGDLAGALRAYQAYRAILERLAAQDPSNAGWQHDLAVSFGRIGDLLRLQGDRAGALRAYQAGHAISERLGAQDPRNTAWQRDLSVSHNKIGAMLRDQGDLAGALRAFQAGNTIAQRLAAQDPGNAGWQSGLSFSHNRIGDVLQAQGDLAGALQSYRAGLAIAERLAAQDAGNAIWQHDLAVCHSNVGDVLRTQRDLAGALAAYQASLAIAERLAARDPRNLGFQHDLSASLYNVGTIAAAQGDRSGATASYRRALEIATRLAMLSPTSQVYLNHLTVVRTALARVEGTGVQK